MNRYKFRDGRQLRCGYTTGTCAAAAAEAAAGFLLTGKKTPSVSILLPAGSTAELSVEFSELEYGEEFQFAAAGQVCRPTPNRTGKFLTAFRRLSVPPGKLRAVPERDGIPMRRNVRWRLSAA